MNKKGIAGLVIFALLALFILPGCVSMDQINTLEQEISSLQSELSTVSAQNQELESDIAVHMSRQEFSAEISNYVTSQDFLAEISNYVTSQEFSADINNYVTKQGLLTDLNSFVTKQELNSTQKVRDSLLNGLSDELQSARRELESMVGSLAKESDVQMLSERVYDLEEEFSQINYVITGLMSYGGYTNSTEMMEFAYGLVDIYDTLNEVQVKLQKLKEAMTFFVTD
jgi:outer membrane murein-binding lipoprotein Lpp